MEARAALSHSATNVPQTQSPVKMDRATVPPSLPVTGPPPASLPSGSSAEQALFLVQLSCSSFYLKITFCVSFSQWTYS